MRLNKFERSQKTAKMIKCLRAKVRAHSLPAMVSAKSACKIREDAFQRKCAWSASQHEVNYLIVAASVLPTKAVETRSSNVNL